MNVKLGKSRLFPLISRIKTNCFHATRIDRSSPDGNCKTDFIKQIIEIRTCGNLYKKWKEEGRFWRVPNGDLTFQVQFVDTHRNITRDKVPIALALHGAPGTCDDFSLLTSYLYNQGVRVITPTFPDFSVYKPGIFRHSLEERVQFIKDFLKTIDVSEIDLLVCHSSSIYAGLVMCLEKEKLLIKSLAMLNPGAHNYVSGTKPFFLMSAMVRGSEFGIFLKFLEYFGTFILKNLARSPLHVNNYLDPLLSATVMTHASIPKARDRLLELKAANFPVFFAFSEDDKLIEKELSYEMSRLLGAETSDICHINKDGIMTHNGYGRPNLKVMAFENGSHYVFRKYPEIVNEAVSEFLKRLSVQ